MNLEFLTVSLIVVASPGTGAAVTIATGLARGARAACLAALGCTLGVLPHMLTAVTGLAAVLHRQPGAFALLQCAGVGYLLYLGWVTWRDGGLLQVDPQGVESSNAGLIRHAVLVNLLNPKLSMFFLAFLPQFIDAAEPRPTRVMLTLSGLFMAMTLVVFALYGTFAARMREHVLARPAVMTLLRRSFAATFVALGIKLALTPR